MTLLEKSTVLILNRNWQAIHVKTPLQAFSMMASGAGTGLDIAEDGNMTPVRWADWLKLPVRPCDTSIGTVQGPVRVPTIMVLARYSRVPRRRPGFNARAVWERDSGTCQYTGRKLKPNEGNIDHVVPRSRGGATSWKNCVLADRKVNSRKGNRLPHEVGLKLIRAPEEPKELPVTRLIRNVHRVPHWDMFLESSGETHA
jgi:5-methylcytosine-specific restriction endonuclease McrA